jgi:surface polysaccharide O-acyltransferase-like enzyme
VPYTGLFVAGYVLGNNLERIKKTKLLTSVYIVSLLSTIGLTYLFNLLNIHGNKILDSHGCLSFYSASNLSINVVIMSASVFILLMRLNFNWLHLRTQNLITSIAGASLGIYVLHTFFLDVLDGRLHVFDHIAPAWLYIIIKWSVIFFLSYGLSIILMKIPLVKSVFGITNSNKKIKST